MIGKIIKSNSHTDYICQIYGENEVESPPSPSDYAFGTFVSIPLGDEQGSLVGVIYNTQLYNPDFGNLGPRLSPEPDLEVFSPDYLAEQLTLVGIKAVGSIDRKGAPTHGVPPQSVQIDSLVRTMDQEQTKSFHLTRAESVEIGYAPLLLGQSSPLAQQLLLHIVQHLRDLFPEHEEKLSVLYQEWSWQTRIQPTGGRS